MKDDCPFCQPPDTDIVLGNPLAYARWDKFPVSPGHLLIIPRRHFADYFEATDDEQQALAELLKAARQILLAEYQPTGFNIGVNIGSTAGQTVMHVHIHLIPRFPNDMEDPRGGVRGVIPSKRMY